MPLNILALTPFFPLIEDKNVFKYITLILTRILEHLQYSTDIFEPKKLRSVKLVVNDTILWGLRNKIASKSIT